MNRLPTLAAALLFACSPGPASDAVVSLPPAEFSTRLGAAVTPQLVDVRTPGEFARGHLARALNFDLNAGDFERRVAPLDRERPVFVYCLTGSRSSVAARWLASAGFREVFDLEGGIFAWRAAGLPQAAEGTASPGMSVAEFERLVGGETPVLVDYYAEWCIPCRRMKPELERLARERAGTLRVERIDADDNQQLVRELDIDGLPTVELYRGGERVWRKAGYTPPEEIVARLDANG